MYFEDLSVGMTKTLSTATIDKDDMLDFANKYDNHFILTKSMPKQLASVSSSLLA